MKNFFVHPALDRRKLELVGWTVRGLDTVSKDADAVAARILRRGAGRVQLSSSTKGTAPRPTRIFIRAVSSGRFIALTKANYRCVLPRPEQLRPRAGEK